MKNNSWDLIVIGGGPAGVTAALRASELGARVALVERQNLGGTCTNDGCVPTRVLAKAARLVRDARQWADYGIEPFEPRLHFPETMGKAQEIVYKIHEKKQLLKTLQEAGITTFVNAGQASFVDPHMIQIKHEGNLRAEKFILAVGGRAHRPDFPGAELALTHSDVWGLNHFPESVAIVGGAATGCQLASIFSDFGARVSVFEISARLLAREDESLSTAVRQAFESRGIACFTGIVGVNRIEAEGNMRRLFYQDADGAEQSLTIAAVIVAVGWPGNIQELNLPVAGVQTKGGYIPVDDTYRTSAPHIYAAGDITGRMMLVQSAGWEARAAAENATLGNQALYNHLIVPHGGFTDPEYGSVGLTEAEARQQEEIAVSSVTFTEMDRAVIDGHTEGFCKLIVSRKDRRLLGAHVVGEQALEIVHLVAAGMASGMKLETLAALEIAYPTYTAVVGVAARRLANELGLLPAAPHWRVLGRPLASEWERLDSAPGLESRSA